MKLLLEDEDLLEEVGLKLQEWRKVQHNFRLEIPNYDEHLETPELEHIRDTLAEYEENLADLKRNKTRAGYNKILQKHLNMLFPYLLIEKEWNPAKCQNFIYELYQEFAESFVSTVQPKEETQEIIKQMFYTYKKRDRFEEVTQVFPGSILRDF